MVTLVALMMWTPLLPVPCPSMSSPCSRTSEAPAALMVMPVVSAPSTPAVPVKGQLIVTDLVIVNMPKPPGSRQLISPPVAVLEMAPAKVLHGAVRLHGNESSPTAETQVRLACAAAGSMCDSAKNAIARIESRLCFMGASRAARVVATTEIPMQLGAGLSWTGRHIRWDWMTLRLGRAPVGWVERASARLRASATRYGARPNNQLRAMDVGSRKGSTQPTE